MQNYFKLILQYFITCKWIHCKISTIWFIAFGWKCLCRVYAVNFLNQQKIIQLIRIKYLLTSDSFYDKRNDKKNRVYDNFQRSYFSISLSIIIIGY